MPYNDNRQIERLEERIQKEIDRRLLEMSLRITTIDSKVDALDVKLDEKFEKLYDKKEENTTWAKRYIITVIVSFITGSGFVGFLTYIIHNIKW